MVFKDLHYRAEQKRRQRSWEMFKYLRSNPHLMNEKNRAIYECFREAKMEYFISKGAENSREELTSIVEFLADMEIKYADNINKFTQKELDTMYFRVCKM